MEYRLLGASGLEVSMLSFGTMTLGGEGRFAAMGNVQAEEARRHIEICMEAGVNLFEVHVQGKSTLAKMVSTICIGDFTSNYLAILHGVDPTPVKTINYLKDTLKENGVREKIISELAKL